MHERAYHFETLAMVFNDGKNGKKQNNGYVSPPLLEFY